MLPTESDQETSAGLAAGAVVGALLGGIALIVASCFLIYKASSNRISVRFKDPNMALKDPKPLPPPAPAPGNNLPDQMEMGSRTADNIAANTYDNIATESHSANSIVNEIGLQPTGHIRSWICKVCIKPSES